MPEKKKPRRDNGAGSIVRRADGRWQGAYSVNGERKYLYGNSSLTKNQFGQQLKAAIAKAERGELVPANKLTIADHMNDWLKQRELDYRPSSFYNVEKRIRRHIIPILGNILVQKLERRHVQRWVNELSKKLKATTIARYFFTLHAAMEDAVLSRIITVNPCEHITLPTNQERTQRAVLTPTEAADLLAQLEGHWLRNIVLYGLATAMRVGEVVTLRWSDIDLKSGTVRVRHNGVHVPGKGFVEGQPKTRASSRTITLPEFALNMLRDHRKEQNKKRIESESWPDPDLVFTKNGTIIPTGTIYSAIRTACKRAGVPIISFHNLRHSAASILLASGVPPKVVQEILGHSSITMTMDIYGHVMPGQQEDAARKMHAALAFDLGEKEAK